MEVEIFYIYTLYSELNKSFGYLEGYNSNPLEKNNRTITMGSSKIYDLQTDEFIGEVSLINTAIGSIVGGVTNNLIQSQYNIFDKLIVPNSTSGFLFANNTIFSPVKHITQDWFGRKVVFTSLQNENPDKRALKIEVYSQSL